jgi:hypothetical protein
VDRNSLQEIRDMSWTAAERLGFPINVHLPLLDADVALRPEQQITDRILAFFATISTSFGFPRTAALEWVRGNGLEHALSEKERAHLTSSSDELVASLQSQVDALFALAWILGLIPLMDFESECGESFIRTFPNIENAEAADTLRRKVALRDERQVVAMCDLAYCLHWGIRDAVLRGARPPGRLHPAYLIERRRGLEWAISREGWDEITLDT